MKLIYPQQEMMSTDDDTWDAIRSKRERERDRGRSHNNLLFSAASTVSAEASA